MSGSTVGVAREAQSPIVAASCMLSIVQAALMLCRHPGNGGRAGALPASGRMLSAFNAFLSPGGTVLRLAGACAIMEERMDEIAN